MEEIDDETLEKMEQEKLVEEADQEEDEDAVEKADNEELADDEDADKKLKGTTKTSNKRSKHGLSIRASPRISNLELMRQCEEAAGCALSKKEKRKLKVQLRLQEKAQQFKPTSNVTSAGVKYTTTETGGFVLSKVKKGWCKKSSYFQLYYNN